VRTKHWGETGRSRAKPEETGWKWVMLCSTIPDGLGAEERYWKRKALGEDKKGGGRTKNRPL